MIKNVTKIFVFTIQIFLVATFTSGLIVGIFTKEKNPFSSTKFTI